MAQGKVVDNLLLTLGLDFSGLDAGFLAADRTIKQNISAINSQKNQIKLQADIDLSRLQGVGSELDKLKVKETALTAQIDAQTAKYRILQGVLEQTRQIKNPQVNTAPMIAAAERNALTAPKELEKLKADLRVVQSQRVQIQVEIEQGKSKKPKTVFAIAFPGCGHKSAISNCKRKLTSPNLPARMRRYRKKCLVKKPSTPNLPSKSRF